MAAEAADHPSVAPIFTYTAASGSTTTSLVKHLPRCIALAEFNAGSDFEGMFLCVCGYKELLIGVREHYEDIAVTLY